MSELAELLTRYGPGDSIEHGGRGYVFARLSLGQLGALESAWRSLYGGGAPARPPFDGAPLGGALPHYLSGPGLRVLLQAMTGCDLAEAEALLAGRPREARHAAACVLFASHGVCREMLLALPEGHPIARELAGLIERGVSG